MPIATSGLLPPPIDPERARLCVIATDDAVFQAVALAYPQPEMLSRFPASDLLDAHQELSAQGSEVVRQAREADAVLVEWRLDLAPVINTLGFHLRVEPTTPLIALCRNGIEEEVAAMAAGCDAATSFPVRPALILSTVLAHRRLIAAAFAASQSRVVQASDAKPEEQVFGPLRINRSAGRLYVNDVEVQLTPREYSLLDFLLSHPEELCTRDEILARVWGINFDTGTNMVDVYMYFLRKKLEAHRASGMIQTVRGRGYRLVLAENRPPHHHAGTEKRRPAGANVDGP